MYNIFSAKLTDLLKVANQDGVITIDSGINGPTVAIVALTHGNEIAGIDALHWLISEYRVEQKLQKGKLFLIINNIKAFQTPTGDDRMCQRYIDRDMNRCWDEVGIGYEYLRREEIQPYIDASDHLFDIHSTTSPSIPMCIPTTNSPIMQDFLSCVIADKYLLNIAEKLSGKALSLYHGEKHQNGISYVVECGSHFDPSAGTIARKNSTQLLGYLGMIDQDVISRDISWSVYDIFECFHAPEVGVYEYQYSQNPASFDFLWQDTIIAMCNNVQYRASQDSYIIMPTKHATYKQEEMWYLARKI